MGIDNQNITQIEAFDAVVRIPRVRADGSYSLHIHPDYDFPANDIAILEMNKRVFFQDSKTVRPVCLPNGEQPPPGQMCFATGWGWTKMDYEPTVDTSVDFLREVMLPIRSPTECEKSNKISYRNNYNATTMLCAGYPEGGADACRGDSGGPLVCQRCSSCNFYLAGIISYGEKCALKGGIYGRYTKVAEFEDWINKFMNRPADQALTWRDMKTCDKVFRSYWTGWAEWTECSATCGEMGIQKRTRECIGDPNLADGNCQGQGVSEEFKSCNRFQCIDECCEHIHVSSIDTIFTRIPIEKKQGTAGMISYNTQLKEQGYRSVYQAGIQYLHYYPSSGHWWIGPTIGQPKGDHYVQSDEVCPERLGKKDWEVFNASQQSWSFYPMQVTCLAGFTVSEELADWSTCNCETSERTRYKKCLADFGGYQEEVSSKYCEEDLKRPFNYQTKNCVCGEVCPEEILVDGGSWQERRSGIYSKLKQASDKVVVYYSEDTGNYIYRTQQNYWWIGDTIGEMSGGFVAQVTLSTDLQMKLKSETSFSNSENFSADRHYSDGTECPPSDESLWRSYQNKKWRPIVEDSMKIKQVFATDMTNELLQNTWSSWSECSGTCVSITRESIPTRSRDNKVTQERQYENCNELPDCPSFTCCEKLVLNTTDPEVLKRQYDRFGVYKVMNIEFNNKKVYVKNIPEADVSEGDLMARSIRGNNNTISMAGSSVYVYYMPSHKVWLSGEELGQRTGGLLGLPFSEHAQHCPEATKTWWAYLNSTWEYDEALTVSCDTEPEYTDWEDFTECDCNTNTQSRQRTCLYNCVEAYDTIESKYCECTESDIEYTGDWAQWSDWSICSTTCGVGAKKRVRKCSAPGGTSDALGSISDFSYFYDEYTSTDPEYMTYDKIGTDYELSDYLCEGDSSEMDTCVKKDCPEWSSWTPWNECSETCGEEGTQYRERECVPGGLILAVRLTIFRSGFDEDDEEICDGSKIEHKQCNRHKCPEWSEWSLWSPCSKTCGRLPGAQTRSRACLQYDDSQALTSFTDNNFINMIPCEGLPKEQMACLPTLTTCPMSTKCLDLKNRHSNINQCKAWTRRGLCNNDETRAFMQTNCKKACCQSTHGELCADVQSRCRSYKSYCMDPKHMRFMKEKCPVTCGTCNNGARSSVLLKGISNLGGVRPQFETTSLSNLGGLGLLMGVAPPGFIMELN